MAASSRKDQNFSRGKGANFNEESASGSDSDEKDAFSLDKTIADAKAFASTCRTKTAQGLASFSELIQESSDVQEFTRPLKVRINKQETGLVLGGAIIASALLAVVFSLCNAFSLAAALIGGVSGALGGWMLGKWYNVEVEWTICASAFGFIVLPAVYGFVQPLAWGAGAAALLNFITPHEDSLCILVKASVFVIMSTIAGYFHEHFRIFSTSILTTAMLVWGLDMACPCAIRTLLLRLIFEKDDIQLYNLLTVDKGINAYILILIMLIIVASSVYLHYYCKAKFRSKRTRF